MKLTLTIDPTVTETTVTIIAPKVNSEVRAIQALETDSLGRIIGTRGSDATVLDVRKVLTFFTKNKAVYARTANGDWRIKQRMYELESSLAASDFARISQSEIVNISAIENLDLSLTGTITVHLKDGSKFFVARRHLSTFKKKLGF